MTTTLDSLSESITLLEREIQEIDSAIVRLSLRKERVNGAIRLLREHSVGAGAQDTNTIEPTPPPPNHKTQSPSRAPEYREKIRKLVLADPSRWWTMKELELALNIETQQVIYAVKTMRSSGELVREERDPVEQAETKNYARYKYRSSKGHD